MSPTAASTTELPMSFSVPEQFHEVDFTVSAEDNTNKLIDKLNMVNPRPSDEQIAHAVLAQQAMYEMLAAAGAVWAGILLCRPEGEGHLSSVMLTVTARPSELANEQTVHRLARTMGAIYPDAEVGVVRLPCGDAVVLTEEAKVDRPVNLLVDGGGPTRVRQMHVFVPIPDRYAMADFAVATENIPQWDECVDIVGAVCKTIEFA
ncbi:hypothetical protein [Actinokineospora enzanensis]|uniref:hypothetical protein n=1 Tax=Actinokineospora enzanensis TaxID=155975 RepID=UPI0003A160A9|nr:hypothetical protein [Actinokineospora enzanensis]